jgi:asparagine synthase (glutamine-hydrolysing)
MCGIAGSIGQIDRKIIESVRRIHNRQSYRGPDDEGSWTNARSQSDRGAQFFFRRLAIIDTSSDGHQPMIDAATGNVIIFNGELYNYRELRLELEQAGIQFQSKSDTEVLLKAYGYWGKDSIHRLRGMFAFAIWDEQHRYVVLARDRLGIKPLYLASVDRSNDEKLIIFASELRSLLASDLVDRKLNPNAVASYVWNGFVTGPDAIVQNVTQLMPGSAAVARLDGSMETFRYWTYPKFDSRQDGVERLDDALRTSIRQHLVSDVPLGIFLSGGIDSSAIAALAVQESSAENICTYNLSFEEADYDESMHARAVATALGTRHTEVPLSQMQFKAQLNDALSSIDQPTFDAINSYFISRAVRDAGITVALAGTGGDELFGGYSSFRDIQMARRASRALSILPESAASVVGNALTRFMVGKYDDVAPQTRWGKSADVLATRGSLVELYQTSYALFTQDFFAELLEFEDARETSYGLSNRRLEELQEGIRGDARLHSISTLHFANFLGERLLRDTDAASMAVSLEVRVPLLDHEVVEAIANVNLKQRFQPLGEKQLLRTIALSKLNPELFDRPKSGFSLPIELWCRQELRDELESTFSDQGLCLSVGLNPAAVERLWRAFQAHAPGIYWSRVWSLFVLLWWCRTHGVTR